MVLEFQSFLRREVKGKVFKESKGLKKGFTTGTCAAAAAKAATIAFLTGEQSQQVSVSLPIDKELVLPVYKCISQKGRFATASVVKDSGDDPDVTDGAEIKAEVEARISEVGGPADFQFISEDTQVVVLAGEGVGIVTKPGLAISVGGPAINPVPRKMIEKAVCEALSPSSLHPRLLTITISVPRGEEIAKQTMNARLGIIGGISILGTTGIVEPLSLSAYKASIVCAIDVAVASGCNKIVFSVGRSSEKVVEGVLRLPGEAFIIVGDHLGFALNEARKRLRPHSCVIIAGQFGKFSKLAAGYFQTHYSRSSIDLDDLAKFAGDLAVDAETLGMIRGANTAREVFFLLKENDLTVVLEEVTKRVRANAERIVEKGIKIKCILVGYDHEAVSEA